MKSVSRAVYRVGLFLAFLMCGISLPTLSGLPVFPFSLIVSRGMDLIYRIDLSAIFLCSSIILYRSELFKKYWQVLFAFFVASFAINLQASSALLDLPTTTMNGKVLAMLSSTLSVFIPIIALTRISGGSMASIFLKKGKIKLGLVVGLIGFFVFAASSMYAATYLFQGRDLTLERVVSWTPWLLVIVMANGLREEPLYRGLFLKKLEPLLGPNSSNLLQALIFSLSHTVAGVGAVQYTPFTAVFVLITFLLGLALGYVMQRTDSLIGPVLFHAGTDIPIFIAVFSNLP
ncbi:MAG: CPBP family intramembrane metalloprotease [Aigarchaeota archaeon]|nr:CPBP family intramembrane metalloprotease [Aigarchaeota archaeon]MDH5703071.1 CPBP family intramembrane metalloprotease [Aigarchaeota archaeon]